MIVITQVQAYNEHPWVISMPVANIHLFVLDDKPPGQAWEVWTIDGKGQ